MTDHEWLDLCDESIVPVWAPDGLNAGGNTRLAQFKKRWSHLAKGLMVVVFAELERIPRKPPDRWPAYGEIHDMVAKVSQRRGFQTVKPDIEPEPDGPMTAAERLDVARQMHEHARARQQRLGYADIWVEHFKAVGRLYAARANDPNPGPFKPPPLPPIHGTHLIDDARED